MARSRVLHSFGSLARTAGLLTATGLLMGAQCACPDEAVIPASYQVEDGELSIDGAPLSFDDCTVVGEAGPFFDTSRVETTLNVQCGEPVLEPAPGEPLFRLTVPLGDIRDGADQTVDLSRLNFIAEWSSDGVPVGPSALSAGSTATVQTVERTGARASYPDNVTDDFTLEARVDIEVAPFTGRGGSTFPGGTLAFTIRQNASNYRIDPGPDPDCM